MASVDDLKRRLHETRPCIKIDATFNRSASYLGGIPELPAGMEWPSWNGQPLSFVAQIDLGDTPKQDWPEWMPREGRLLFFYDPEQAAWGFDPADRGRSLVAHVKGSNHCAERIPPSRLLDMGQFKRKDVMFTTGVSHPSCERIGGYAAKLSDEDFDEIQDFLESLEGEGPRHQLFGWPSPVQGDAMELECQLASNGVYVGAPEGYRDPRVAELERGAADWELLLQLDTDDDAEMMWGDCGALYFWVRRQDAAQGDFSKVWTVLQCH